MSLITEQFGDIDIYLFDQLMKGRFYHFNRIVDIGCGAGRNLYYFLQNGFAVFGIDQNEQAIDSLRSLSDYLVPGYPKHNFVVGDIENMSFPEASFDLAICSAVLHFAKDKAHFELMLRACWHLLKPGGYFFARLASENGIEDRIIPQGDGRYMLPDGSTRYLVNQEMLLGYTTELGGILYEPIKTTNVQNMRCMATWCVQKQ